VKEQHGKNLAHLAELDAPIGIVVEGQDDVSDFEDLEEDLDVVNTLEPVAM
jgi:hypothetical protein